MNFVKFLRTPFFTEHLSWLLLAFIIPHWYHRSCMHEHLFEYHYSEGHGDLLQNVSTTLIHKRHGADPKKREDDLLRNSYATCTKYWRQHLNNSMDKGQFTFLFFAVLVLTLNGLVAGFFAYEIFHFIYCIIHLLFTYLQFPLILLWLSIFCCCYVLALFQLPVQNILFTV